MSLAEQVRQRAIALLGHPNPSNDELNEVLRLLAKFRSQLIQNTLLKGQNARVLGGPFAGMEFIVSSAEGCHIPKLLGCYEQELHPFVKAAAAENYDAIVNIGCAEGYYAVGLARACPSAQVFAYDANQLAQQACGELARRNGVAERIVVGGFFEPKSFHTFDGRRVLFIVDIEGNELELLQGTPAVGLASFDFVIECHDVMRRQVSERLNRHFATTHFLRIVKHQIRPVELPPLFDQLGHLDQLLAIWEWRSGPTPWLIAASRRGAEGAFAKATLQNPS